MAVAGAEASAASQVIVLREKVAQAKSKRWLAAERRLLLLLPTSAGPRIDRDEDTFGGGESIAQAKSACVKNDAIKCTAGRGREFERRTLRNNLAPALFSRD